MSFWLNDETGIGRILGLCQRLSLNVTLDFGFSWSPGTEVLIYLHNQYGDDRGEQHRIWDCPRAIRWAPLTPMLLGVYEDVIIEYGGCGDDSPMEHFCCDHGPPRTAVIAEVEEVRNLVEKAEYQAGYACLEVKREFGFGRSTVSLVVRRINYYKVGECLKLSVMVEHIDRDDYNRLLQFQQSLPESEEYIADRIPYAWKGNELDVSQMPKSPFRKIRSDVVDDLRHTAYEALPLAFKRRYAQSEAVERGLSYTDFLWEHPNHHERRVARHKDPPGALRDTCLRDLRLDIDIRSDVWPYDLTASLSIAGIELTVLPITPSPPPRPTTFSFINNLHLDVPYADPGDTAAHNQHCSPRKLNISANGMATLAGADSAAAGTCISSNGSVITLNVNGPLQIMGDLFAAPIHGGNVGGRNNTNHALPSIEAVVSAVLRTMRSEQCGESRTVEEAQERRSSAW
ncbi:hypothetical protein PTI98_012315 [Pleurotus ostreatus]|nr:hypothetical protein PTI98_012315 [Pleurotus ostreatus]